MFSIRRYIAVAKKETLEMRRNVLFFMMTILAPIIFYFLFAYGFPLDAKNTPTAIVDFDNTIDSRRFIDYFERSTNLFNIKFVTSGYAEADREMNLGNIRLTLVVPHRFSADIQKGRPVTIQAFIDGAYPNSANLIAGYVESIAGQFHADILTEFLAHRHGMGGEGIIPVYVSSSAWYNPSFRSEDFILPAVIALVMVFFPPIVASITLAREKETGSILNMYCSSVSKTEYLLGKVTPYIIISFGNVILFALITVFLFKVPMRGSIVVFLASSFFYVASVIAVGLLVATLVSSQVAAILITFVGTVMPAFLYSGFMVPISSMDPSAQANSQVIQATYFIDLLRKLMVKGASFAHVSHDFFILIGFCIVLYALCIIFFKKRIG